MESTVKSYDKVIAEQLATIPNTLMSIKGIGPVFAAGIIAEVGDINRFPNQAALGKYAGIAQQYIFHYIRNLEKEDTRSDKA
jgi:transposase